VGRCTRFNTASFLCDHHPTLMQCDCERSRRGACDRRFFFRLGIVPDRAARDTTCCCIALPAWVGFIFTEHNHKINASLKRIKSYGYIDRIITIDELISESTRDVFNKMCVPSHCLTPSTPAVTNCRCSKGPVPYRSNPPF